MLIPDSYANNSRAEGNKGLFRHSYVFDSRTAAENVAAELRKERNGTVKIYDRTVKADNRVLILYIVVARYPSLGRKKDWGEIDA